MASVRPCNLEDSVTNGLVCKACAKKCPSAQTAQKGGFWLKIQGEARRGVYELVQKPAQIRTIGE